MYTSESESEYDSLKYNKEVNQRAQIVTLQAALEYIPKSTLSDRVTGWVRLGVHSGVSRSLEDEEEEEIVQWIRGCAEIGCAKSIPEVQAVVSTIVAKKLGITSVSISHGWWDKFRRPHPEFVMRSGKILHTNMLLQWKHRQSSTTLTFWSPLYKVTIFLTDHHLSLMPMKAECHFWPRRQVSWYQGDEAGVQLNLWCEDTDHCPVLCKCIWGCHPTPSHL